MAQQTVQEWTLQGWLKEIQAVDKQMPDRRFAFILGAGASVASGIPSGQKLAQTWLSELHSRECSGDLDEASWLAQGGAGIAGLVREHAATHYGAIFERRFGADPESGYAALEVAMEGIVPSLGYTVLGEVLARTRHNVVISTNFDNLVADALVMHGHPSPLLVAHESLAGFVRPNLRRPLVAKIHRDLLYSPKNDVAGVSTLEDAWRIALRKLFQFFTPIVVGYGGNDGSLMGLLDSLAPGEISGRMTWTYREGSPPPPAALQVLQKHRGVMVRIADFDSLMAQLASVLISPFNLTAIAQKTEEVGRQRTESYRAAAQTLMATLARGDAAQRQLGQDLANTAAVNSNDWWAWELKARAEADGDKRDAVYQEALKAVPDSADLANNYAAFLMDERHDIDAAEAMFKRAALINPRHANSLGNYGVLLKKYRKDMPAAAAKYREALQADPQHANNLGNYANLLATVEGRLDEAEDHYRRALLANPAHARNQVNYAWFLAHKRGDLQGAEQHYRKAVELAPDDPDHLHSLAEFLAFQKHDEVAAGAVYQRAAELEPQVAERWLELARSQQRSGQPKEAVASLRAALALEPRNAGLQAEMAALLADPLKDLDAAEAAYRAAMALEPDNPAHERDLGAFLADHRQDPVGAATHLRHALQRSPNDVASVLTMARFLAYNLKDLQEADALFSRGAELAPQDPQTALEQAQFLAFGLKDADRARAAYARAANLDPASTQILMARAGFLYQQQAPAEEVEPLLRRAAKLAPTDAEVQSNLGIFLFLRRRDLPGAEGQFRLAIQAAPQEPNYHANLASVLLCQGTAQALQQARAGVDAVLRLSVPNVTPIVASALLGAMLVAEEVGDAPGLQQALASLKGAFEHGFERAERRFEEVYSFVMPRLPKARHALYHALAVAVNDAAAVSALNGFEDYMQLPASPPFAWVTQA